MKRYDSFSDLFYASYSGLQTLAFALQKGLLKYDRGCYAFRESVIKKFKNGECHVSDLFDNVVRQLTAKDDCCWYCGASSQLCGGLTADHVFPRAKGGESSGENLIMVCRSCNSSKGAKDLMCWYRARGEFPPMRVLAHYLKLAYQYASTHDLMLKSLDNLNTETLPFDYSAFPISYPQPCDADNLMPIKWTYREQHDNTRKGK